MQPTDSHRDSQPNEHLTTRRDVVKTAAWIVPAVVTLAVIPSFAGVATGAPPPPPQDPT